MINLTIEQTLEILGLGSIRNAVFSSLIIKQLQTGLSTGRFDAGAVVDVIKQIQTGKLKSKKGIRQFKGNILKGFSYAHWFEARFIAQNLLNYWEMSSGRSRKFENMLNESFEAAGVKEGDLITKEAISRLTHNMIEGFFEKSKENALTGEWIIFYQADDKNIYLTVAEHGEKDEDIYVRMALGCENDYPYLFPKDKTEGLRKAKEKGKNSRFG